MQQLIGDGNREPRIADLHARTQAVHGDDRDEDEQRGPPPEPVRTRGFVSVGHRHRHGGDHNGTSTALKAQRSGPSSAPVKNG